MVANRYTELLALLPNGSFYTPSGTVLPLRSSPYEFILAPVPALRSFSIFVNGQFRGHVTSDANGQALVIVSLNQGRQEIALVDDLDQSRFPAYATVRAGATVLAAHAEVFEAIDAELDEVQQSLALETATAKYIEDVYGQHVRQSNNIGWVTDSYRRLMRWLRQGFRLFGSKLQGIRQAVAGYTSSLPLRTPRTWRPWWRLGHQLMPNGDVQTYARVTVSPLTNINSRAPAFIHAAYAATAANAFPGPFTQPPGFALGGSIVTSPTLGRMILTHASANFARPGVDLVGTLVEIAGAQNIINNGTFRVAEVLSDQKLEYEATGMSEPLFPGTYLVRGLAQKLEVTFSTGWNGGAVTIAGTDGNALVVSELFTPVAAQPLAVAETIQGTIAFSSVASAQKSVIGSGGTASLGISTRFVTLVDIGDLNALTAVSLFFLITPDRLRWASPSAVASAIATSGRYELPSLSLVASFYGLIPDGGGGYAVGADHFFVLEVDNHGPVIVDLSNESYNAGAGFAGGASPRTAAQVITTINNYFSRDPRYGAIVAEGTITCPAGASIVVGNTITIPDGVNPALIFEFVTAGSATAGRVRVLFTAGDTATTVAASLAAAINTGSNDGAGANPSAVGAIRIAATSTAAVVALTNNFGGSQGNQTITVPAAFATTNMTGGVSGALIPATAVVGAFSNAVRLSTSSTGAAASLAIHPSGGDATPTVLGLPRFSTALSAGVATQAVLLDCPTSRLPAILDPVILHAAFADTVVQVIPPFIQPAAPVALEFFFSAAWRGGSLRVTGTIFGQAQQEVFAPPSSAVKSGLAASSTDGITVTTTESFVGIEPGHFFRRTVGGLGAFVRYVDGATQLRLHTAIAGFPWGPVAWAATKATKTKGALAFQTILQVDALTVAGAGTAGEATLSVIDGDQKGYDVIVGRSLRASGTGGAGRTVTPGTGPSSAVFADTATPFNSERADLNGWLLIQLATAGSTANVGLHKITTLAGSATGGITGVGITHQDADRGMQFVTETLPGGATWRLYSRGDVVRAVGLDQATGDVTLYPPGVQTAWATGARVELVDELPFATAGIDGPQTLTVDVDRSAGIPTANQTDALTLAGTTIPDGWRIFNQAGLPVLDIPGYFRTSRFQFSALGVDAGGIGTTDLVLQREILQSDVRAYRGFILRAQFWVQQHVTTGTVSFRIDFSFDGTTFAAGTAVAGSTANPEPVAGTMLNSAGSGGVLDPELVEAQAEVPFNATTVIVRLRVLGAAVANRFSIERCTVVATTSTGLFLGLNTPSLSEHEAKFGELLYVWSPENLTDAERTGLGVTTLGGAGFPLQKGTIDRVTNTHGVWARFDVSEYGAGTDPINTRGAYNEITWLAATLTNMEVVVGTPARASYVRPSKLSSTLPATLVFTAPSNATLAEASAHEGTFPQESFTDDRLLESGLPVPATPSITAGVLPWRFLSATVIQVASAAAGDPAGQQVFNAAATYTITYRRPIRVQIAAFDLGVSFASYLWVVDAAVFFRREPGSTVFRQTQQLIFLADFRARLDDPSDEDPTQAVLVRDTGFTQEQVAAADWSFIDSRTVQLDPTVFDPNSVYSLEFNALFPKYTPPARVVIETRSSAVSLADVLLQTYRTVALDEVVNRAHQFHQFRATITGVVTLRDIEITGLGLRGIRLYGSSPYAPGISTF